MRALQLDSVYDETRTIALRARRLHTGLSMDRNARIGSSLLVALFAAGCETAIEPFPGPVDEVTQAALQNAPIRRLRRLSNREYNNVVRDLLGVPLRTGRGHMPAVPRDLFDNAQR